MPNAIAGSSIANDALRYNGAGYQYGGSPATGVGHWDCSSFVSWVMGHDLKMSVPMYPNGTYTGSSHGPTAAQYLVWSGAATVPRASVASGDLCCWPTHIGIAIAQNQMISAYDTAKGTLVTAIDGAGPTGEPMVIRRVNGAVGQATTTGAANSGASGCKFPGQAAMIYYALFHRIEWRRNIQGCELSYWQSPRQKDK